MEIRKCFSTIVNYNFGQSVHNSFKDMYRVSVLIFYLWGLKQSGSWQTNRTTRGRR